MLSRKALYGRLNRTFGKDKEISRPRGVFCNKPGKAVWENNNIKGVRALFAVRIYGIAP